MKSTIFLMLLLLLMASCTKTEIIFKREKIFSEVNFYSFVNQNDDSLTNQEIYRLLKKEPLVKYLNTVNTEKDIVLLIYSYPKRFKENDIEFEPLEVAIIKHSSGKIEIVREEFQFNWNLPPPDAETDSISQYN